MLFLFACHDQVHPPATTKDGKRQLAKFEPSDGRVLLFVGQELEAIGGTDL